ncbi:MAG: DUF2085 domain-containing protein [bacterium]|nr:DUF2085 domain-containing protein [bacterium]
MTLSSLAAPALQAVRGYPAGEGAYRMLSHICHQYPSRCVWVAGRPSALCARCTAGYLGVAAMALAMPWLRPRRCARRIGLALLVVAVAEPWARGLAGDESNLMMRLILGAAGGVGVCLVTFPHLKSTTEEHGT